MQLHKPRIAAMTALLIIMLQDPSAARQDPTADAAHLRRSLSSDVGSLDPHLANSGAEYTLAADLFSGLTRLDSDGRVVPGLAEAWTVSDDGLRYLFLLRPNLLWSDGSPLDIDDVVQSFRRAVTPATAAIYASYLAPIRNATGIMRGELPANELAVSATAERWLLIELVHPTPHFLQLLAMPIAAIVPADSAARNGASWTLPGRIVTSGAYLLSDRVPQNRLTLARNTHYYDAGSVYFSRVDYLIVPNLGTALKMFRSGEIDVTDEVPVNQVDWIRANIPKSLKIDPVLGLYYFVINTAVPPFDDRRVRLALSLALDRDILTERVLRSGEASAFNLVPPATENYHPGPVLAFREMPLEERQRLARELLRDAGFSRGKPLSFTFRYNADQNHKRVAVAAAAMWGQVGANVRLQSADFKVHFSNLENGLFEVARAGWSSFVNDPLTFLLLVEGSFSTSNDSRYANDEYDEIISRIMQLGPGDTRAELIAQAESIVLTDHPVIPLFWFTRRALVNPEINGWQTNLRYTFPSQYLSRSASPGSSVAHESCSGK